MCNFVRSYQVILFVVLTYIMTWGIWGIGLMQLDGQSTTAGNPHFFLFFYAGSFGPTIAALIITALTDGRAEVRGLLKRLLHVRQHLVVYGVTFFLVPLIFLVGYLLLGITTRDVEQLSLAALTLVLLMPLNAVLSGVISGVGPLGEEIGWRGFLLPRLLQHLSEPSSNIILGVIWTFWHLPLFVFPDWRYEVHPLPFVVLYLLMILGITIMFTRLWRWSHGSLFIAILFHGVVNVTVSYTIDPKLWNIDHLTPVMRFALATVLVGIAALIFMGLSRTLMRSFEVLGDREEG